MLDLGYIGTAMKNPLTVSMGKTQLTSGADVIRESIADILQTPLGERFFLPDYGSRVMDVLFQPNDNVLEALLRETIREAIEKWERRVRFEDIEVERSIDAVTVAVSVTLLASNEVVSYIYPFYLGLNFTN